MNKDRIEMSQQERDLSTIWQAGRLMKRSIRQIR